MLVGFLAPSGDVTGLMPHCVQCFVLRSVPLGVQDDYKRVLGFFVGHALGIFVREVFHFQNDIGLFAVEKRAVCLLIQGMQMSRVTKPLPPNGIPHAIENVKYRSEVRILTRISDFHCPSRTVFESEVSSVPAKVPFNEFGHDIHSIGFLSAARSSTFGFKITIPTTTMKIPAPN